jgi:hypothetical protein
MDILEMAEPFIAALKAKPKSMTGPSQIVADRKAYMDALYLAHKGVKGFKLVNKIVFYKDARILEA